MSDFIEPLLLFVTIYALMVAVQVYAIVRKMHSAPEVEELPHFAPDLIAWVPAEVEQWLKSNDFHFLQAYKFHRIVFGVWVQRRDSLPQRRFAFYHNPSRATYEFITCFSDEDSLTTCKNRSAFMFPRRFGSFIQSFPNATIEQLWDSHLRGEEHVLSALSVPLLECRMSQTEGLKHGIISQTTLVRSLAFWPLRGVYWYSLKRFLMQNRPIWTQKVDRLYPRVK